MGAGNTLRWREHAGLRTMMDAVVEGIYECRNKTNGYIMAYVGITTAQRSIRNPAPWGCTRRNGSS